MTVYSRPGSADALMSYESRYGHFIGGEWVPPAKGQYFENISPVNGQPFCEVARSTQRTSTRRWMSPRRRAPRGARRPPASAPTSSTRSPTASRRTSRRSRSPRLGQRQAHPRDAGRRHPARRRSLPLLRRRASRPGGLAQPARRRHRRVPLPRAAGRRRPDHPVELPDPDGDVEARSGARGGQLRRAQAGRADARRRSCS